MNRGRGAMKSDYMHWAKQQKPVRYALSSSEVPHFRLDTLPLSMADLDLDGASHPRYAPLREAIAAQYNVAPECVVTADGTSMATVGIGILRFLHRRRPAPVSQNDKIEAQLARAEGGALVAQRMARTMACPAGRTSTVSVTGSRGSRSGRRAQPGSSDTAAAASIP